MSDSGYRDKARAAVYAMDGVLLLTPDTGWARAQEVLGAACGVTAGQVSGWQASRQMAIEPVFDLLSPPFDAWASQTAAVAGYWVCVDIFRVGGVAVTGGDADECAAGIADARCQAHSNRLPITRIMKHPRLKGNSKCRERHILNVSIPNWCD